MFGNLFNQKKDPTQSLPDAMGQTPQPAQPAMSQNAVVGSSMDPTRRQDVSALSHLDPRASQVMSHAQNESSQAHLAFIEPEHILLGLLYDQEVFTTLSQFSLDAAKVTRDIKQKQQSGTFSGQPTLSATSKQIIEEAYASAKHRDSQFITPEDILIALFSPGNSVSSLLTQSGVTRDQLEEKLAKSKGFTMGKKSVLTQFGIDLTEKAKEGSLDPVSGREKEVERLVHILLRRSKNNPIIIGEAGVGKTAIVEGLAQSIVKGETAKDLLSKRIIQIDVSSLVAGASHRGEFEERLRSVVKEAMASAGQIILFIDEIHTLIGTGETEGALDASNIIKPFLARGQMQLIGTTTTAEYRKYFEKDKAFARRFQPITADEPSEEAAVGMLEILKPKYEKFHKVVITKEAIDASVFLSKKYIGERFLPDKAVDLLDEAAAEVRLRNSEGKRQDTNVGKSDIEKVVSAWTGIPVTKLTEDESQKLLQLEDLIHKRLIDQVEAVKVVAEAVRRGRIGLSSANRPIASFVFLGPTGVGKTELAKTLAEILFGRPDAMIRLDMSEYMEKHEVAKLIGAPPGYVGYEEGGQLTEAVRAKPYSIVLFDEVEKAHPDVFNILLQLLEDGRVTDNKGNTISFKNTIVIATSNIGSALIQQQLSQGSEGPEKSKEEHDKIFADLQKMLMDELHKFFRPELLNRFDGVVMFKPLGREDMGKIAELGIGNTKKLLKEQGFDIQLAQNALKQLAVEGYDPVYGARPLRRLIQTAIENPIAMYIISKKFVPGDTITIDFDVAKNEFTFIKAQGGSTAPAGQVPPQGETVAQPAPTPEIGMMPPPPPPPAQTGATIDQPMQVMEVGATNANGTA